jgi:hypothetical protein
LLHFCSKWDIKRSEAHQKPGPVTIISSRKDAKNFCEFSVFCESKFLSAI